MTDEERDKRMDEVIAAIPPSKRIPLNYGTFPDPRAKERRWMCYSTCLAEVWLMLYCANTNAQGVVKDPSREEWSWAFDCPSNPKRWPYSHRVTLMEEGRP